MIDFLARIYFLNISQYKKREIMQIFSFCSSKMEIYDSETPEMERMENSAQKVLKYSQEKDF